MKYPTFIFLATIFFLITSAVATTGYIDTSATNNASVCHDSTCTNPTPGVINFELSQQPSVVVDSVTGVSGYVWGNELGWINMNPTGAGVRFSNTTTGLLEGKAWSQVSGWINFAATGQSVTINPTTGEFIGWAWTGGPFGGWIKFDCGNSSTCVKTTWRASSSPAPTPPPGAPLLDVCSNIEGLQSSVPVGYTFDSNGQCVQAIDVCQNILGDQKVLPIGYVLDSIGACVPDTFDFCPNIKGIQQSVSKGFVIDDVGDCVKQPIDFCPSDKGIQTSYDDCVVSVIDVCPNLPGAQSVIPEQHVLLDGLCYSESFDYCPNIDGVQVSIPKGSTISQYGECIPEKVDACRNLGGVQDVVPNGFKKSGEDCFFELSEENDFINTTPDGVRVVAFSFVPSTARIISNNPIAKLGVVAIDSVFGTTLTATPYKVDLLSLGISFLGLIIFILLMIILIKLLRRKPPVVI